jgi:GTP-binding protein LepA
MNCIRNFSIIAHIDHGKSTLADRMIEETQALESRLMKDQVLDQMELERERGITIKMQPIRMHHKKNDQNFQLNLIDTPGHIDFGYEVSRALSAVEGVVLLVDATQGVQAQTLTTLQQAKKLGLKIIPALSKIDSPLARIDEISLELAEAIGIELEEIYYVSGKTGEGVNKLLDAIVDKIPGPELLIDNNDKQALIFDFQYDSHRGIIIYARLFKGSIQKNDQLFFANLNKSFSVSEVGIFAPHEKPTELLSTGEIGYIVTGIKEPGVVSVGDTLVAATNKGELMPGFKHPAPVIWASIYPESQDDFTLLRQSLERLKLTDSSLSFEEEASLVLGRGYRCGFLGMLHLEIVTERLIREYDVEIIIASPSIAYLVTTKDDLIDTYYSASSFPDYSEIKTIEEQWCACEVIAPAKHTDGLMPLFYDYEAVVQTTKVFGDGRTKFSIEMPLRELMRGFFDELKRVSSGYASISYNLLSDWRLAEVVKLTVLVAEDEVPAFSRIISERKLESEAKKVVEKLHEILPRQQFKTKIQASAKGRILASATLSAFRKDVTAKLYGGDVTRKRKLLEKQKKGKKKRANFGSVTIPQDVFLKMVREN